MSFAVGNNFLIEPGDAFSTAVRIRGPNSYLALTGNERRSGSGILQETEGFLLLCNDIARPKQAEEKAAQ